jgi:ABC-type transport system involved in multi-copper enzyme maturation permease subunit
MSDLQVMFPSAALVKRELITDLRRPRSFMCLGIFVAVCILVVWGNFPRQGQALNPAAIAAYSYSLVTIIMSTLLVGCALFIPGLAGGTIVAEKEQRTFDLLHLTLIRPAGILLAKLLNTLGVFVVMTVAILPVLGTVFFLIGVDWVEVARMLAVILVTSASCAMVGIACSARFRKTAVAVITSYVGMFILMGAPLMVVDLWARAFRVRGVRMLTSQLSRVIAPLGALRSSGQTKTFLLAILYQAIFAVVCFFLALRILRRPPEPAKVETKKPIDDVAVLEARRKKFPFYLIDPLQRKKPIEDLQNPMLVKELRWGTMGRTTILIRVFYTSFIVLLIASAFVLINTIYVTARMDYNLAIFTLLMIQMCLTVTIAPALIANALTKEYEIGNIDMLRLTLLSPQEIVLGKLLAGAVCLSPVLLAAFLAGLPLLFVALFFQGAFAVLFTGYITLLVCALVSLSLGLLASLLTRRTGASIVLSYFLSILIFGGLALLCFVVGQWLVPWPSSRGPTSDAAAFSASFLSPIAGYWANYMRHRYHWGMRGATSLVNGYWFGNVVAFSLLGRAIIRFCVARFARVGMRDR